MSIWTAYFPECFEFPVLPPQHLYLYSKSILKFCANWKVSQIEICASFVLGCVPAVLFFMPNVLCLRLSWQNRGRLWGRLRFEVGFGFYPWMDFRNFRICVAFDIKVGTKRKERFLGDFTRRGATLLTTLSSPLNETFMHSFNSCNSFLARTFTRAFYALNTFE